MCLAEDIEIFGSTHPDPTTLRSTLSWTTDGVQCLWTRCAEPGHVTPGLKPDPVPGTLRFFPRNSGINLTLKVRSDLDTSGQRRSEPVKATTVGQSARMSSEVGPGVCLITKCFNCI